jgi:hypothetical protein
MGTLPGSASSTAGARSEAEPAQTISTAVTLGSFD